MRCGRLAVAGMGVSGPVDGPAWLRPPDDPVAWRALTRFLLFIDGMLGIRPVWTIEVGGVGLPAETVPQPSSRQRHQHRGRAHRDREQHLAVGVGMHREPHRLTERHTRRSAQGDIDRHPLGEVDLDRDPHRQVSGGNSIPPGSVTVIPGGTSRCSRTRIGTASPLCRASGNGLCSVARVYDPSG